MLITEWPVLLLIAFVGGMLVSSVFALFTREDSREEPVRAIALSDGERQSFEAMALKAKKRYQLDRKMKRRGTRDAASEAKE